MAPRKDAISKQTAAKIDKLAQGVLKAVKGGKNPFVDIPIRSLANVTWSDKKRLVELGGQKQKRYFFNVSMATSRSSMMGSDSSWSSKVFWRVSPRVCLVT